MNGTIEGGWGYVIAVYGISWGVLLGYALTLLFQSRSASVAADGTTPPQPGSTP